MVSVSMVSVSLAYCFASVGTSLHYIAEGAISALAVEERRITRHICCDARIKHYGIRAASRLIAYKCLSLSSKIVHTWYTEGAVRGSGWLHSVQYSATAAIITFYATRSELSHTTCTSITLNKCWLDHCCTGGQAHGCCYEYGS